MIDTHRKDQAHYRWRKGLGLLLERAPGERFPCDGLTDLFFPAPAGGAGARLVRRDVNRAIAICRTCPRIIECRRLADERKERHGVWGGVWFHDIHGHGRHTPHAY